MLGEILSMHIGGISTVVARHVDLHQKMSVFGPAGHLQAKSSLKTDIILSKGIPL